MNKKKTYLKPVVEVLQIDTQASLLYSGSVDDDSCLESGGEGNPETIDAKRHIIWGNEGIWD